MPTAEIKLTHPVEVNGTTYAVISLRAATRDDLSTIHRQNSSAYLKGLKLAARLADLPPRTLEKLVSDDDPAVVAIGEFVFQQIDLVTHG